MPWPILSPVVNLIEHLRDEFQRATQDFKVKNADEKFNILSQAWVRIPQSKTDNLIESMPRRCKGVINCHGYPTKHLLC